MIELKKQGPKGLCQYNKANRHKSRYQRHTDQQTNRPTNQPTEWVIKSGARD